MRKVIDEKQKFVKELVEEIQSCHSLAVVRYHFLNVASLTALRKELATHQTSLKIVKNRLFKRAADSLKYSEINEFLVGPNAFVFNKGDDLKAFKVLANFAKKNKKFKLISGIYENKVLSTEEINLIANLPTKDELLGMFMNCINYPIRSFAIAVNAIAEQKAQSAN